MLSPEGAFALSNHLDSVGIFTRSIELVATISRCWLKSESVLQFESESFVR